MRVNDVNNLVTEFQELATENMDAAAQKLNELFSLLLKRDKFYIITENGRPVIKPIQENSPERYLRIFTHQELAAAAGEPVKITSLELCKLVRHWFLRGVSGAIVNDGANWFMLPMPDILSLFLRLVADKDINQGDAGVIELYNSLQQGDYFRILYHNGAFCYFGHETQGEEWEQAKLSDLTDTAKPITTPNGVEVSSERVKTIISYLEGLDPDSVDCNTSTLDFIPEPKAEEARPTAEVTKKRFSFTQTKDKLAVKLKNLPKCKLKMPSKKAFLITAAGFLAFVLCLFCASAIRDSGLSKFNKSIKAGNYTQSQTVYVTLSPGQQNKADMVLSDHIKGLISQYAVNDITEAELSAHLSALKEFPSAADDVEAAVQVAIKLSASKTAYQAGIDAKSTADRLHLWRNVIEADVGSWTSIQKDIGSHETAYVGEVTADAQSYVDCGLYGKAFQVSQDLLYWYPNNIKVSSLANELNQYASYDVNPLPIEILDVRTSIPSMTSDVDLFILWKNTSAKAITEIDFFVTPYNEFDKETAKPFKAVDTKGYAPGEGPDSRTWGWASAWNAPNIKSAVVTSISVTFEGGITRDFSIPKQ